MEKLRKNISIRVLLLFLYISLYIGNTAFFHTHHYVTFSVTHSHLFFKNLEGIPEHGHDKASLETIDQFNSIIIDFILFFCTLGAICILLFTLRPFHLSDIILQIVNACNLRAPPIFS